LRAKRSEAKQFAGFVIAKFWKNCGNLLLWMMRLLQSLLQRTSWLMH